MRNTDWSAIEDGTSESGVYFQIGKYRLAYADVYSVRVNGQEFMSENGTKAECYHMLEEKKITSFARSTRGGKTSYTQIHEKPVDDPDSDPDGGDAVQ